MNNRNEKLQELSDNLDVAKESTKIAKGLFDEITFNTDENLDNLLNKLDKQKLTIDVLTGINDEYNKLNGIFRQVSNEILGKDYYNAYWNPGDINMQTGIDIIKAYETMKKGKNIWRIVAMIVIAILSITIPPLIFLLMYI